MSFASHLKTLFWGIFILSCAPLFGRETETLKIPLTDENSAFERVLWVYPNEVHPGDTIYFCVEERLRNADVNKEQWPPILCDMAFWYQLEPRISCTLYENGKAGVPFELLDERYVLKDTNPWFTISRFHEDEIWASMYHEAFTQPEKHLIDAFAREIPLPDDIRFLEPISKETPGSDPVMLKFHVQIRGCMAMNTAEFQVQLLPREPEEDSVLSELHRGFSSCTPSITGSCTGILEMLRILNPELKKQSAYPPSNGLDFRLQDFQDIKMTLLEPDVYCSFVRVFSRPGIFKPEMKNIPETVPEWKHLEESLSPSTFRDEVQFLRMVFELSENENESEEKLGDLVEWLQNRPLPQRISMSMRSLDLNSDRSTVPMRAFKKKMRDLGETSIRF